ncbi:MAG: LuxR C-terminal-related transcriptional regulator [Eggerthellaceae bacterium]
MTGTARIQEKFVISPATVKTHVRHIYEKCDVHNRAELMASGRGRLRRRGFDALPGGISARACGSGVRLRRAAGFRNVRRSAAILRKRGALLTPKRRSLQHLVGGLRGGGRGGAPLGALPACGSPRA